MTNTDLFALDAPLRDHTDDDLARPLPVVLLGARTEVIAAARDLLAIPESSLETPWAWTGESEAEVRYGAYRAAEALEAAETDARALIAPTEATERAAARIIAPATAARWDLNGLLLPLDETLIDADPGGGEWPIRIAVGHVIGGQRASGWGTAWWQLQGFDITEAAMPKTLPDGFWETLPEDAVEATGSVDDVLARFDACLDYAAERFAGLPDERLAVGARWAGFPITVGFRLGRWSSHIREHTIQVEKTLAMIGHVPGEPARLVRNLLAAYGRAESAVFGRDAEPGGAVTKAIARIAEGAGEARAAAASARRTAEEAGG